jgi:FMN-dependent NADH-azoreductase
MKILQLTSSPRLSQSTSTALAEKITARIKVGSPNAQVFRRDLVSEPHPLIDDYAVEALFTAPEQRTVEQKARVALDDALIEQLMDVDVIVVGAPMYNFGIPVQLKAWVDAVCRVGVTFTYDENGSNGLVSGKKVYLAVSRGGNYLGMPEDYQLPYLQYVLSFLGMTDIEVIVAEGMDMGADSQVRGMDSAYGKIETLFS